jgi:NADH:ubiquinone oxidoreductase subunit E
VPGEIEVPVKVTVCVGSSCHIRGSRAVLKRFAEIIKEKELEKDVALVTAAALVGSFCMERCGEWINWKFGDEEISSASLEQAERTLRERLAEVAHNTSCGSST